MRWATLVRSRALGRGRCRGDAGHADGRRGGAEVCRFRAGDREKPIERWLSAQAVTCVASDAALTFPPGLWNVFARAKGAVSIDPILVDGAAAPANLAIALVPAATVVLQLPPGATGVLYAPKHVIAFPAAERTTVPAGEELWLIVIVEGSACRRRPDRSARGGNRARRRCAFHQRCARRSRLDSRLRGAIVPRSRRRAAFSCRASRSPPPARKSLPHHCPPPTP